MNRKLMLFLTLFCLIGVTLLPLVFASTISNLTIPSNVRLGEKVSISGTFDDGNQFILCRFLVYDINTGFAVDRWTDEYTFSNGTFYAEKVLAEPPYYRGDDFNLVVTCGSAQADGNFTVSQPLGFAHPVQQTWGYLFEVRNQETFMFVFVAIAGVAIIFAAILFLIKRGVKFAG